MNSFFSDSWYRISEAKIALSPEVEIIRQYQNRERWYLLLDPISGNYFKVKENAYLWLSRMDKGVTIEEGWKKSLERDPDNAPSQEEVFQLIAQLLQNNLITIDKSLDITKLMKRVQKRESNKLGQKIKGLFSPQVNLFNPDPAFRLLAKYFYPLYSSFGFILWSSIFLLAITLAFQNFDELQKNTLKALDPSNWLTLILITSLAKIIHECGHGITCRVLGGAVPRCGVTFLMLTVVPSPLPYLDVSSSYAFNSKKERLLVACGGLMYELLSAAICMILWSLIGDSPFKRFLYHWILVTSITTVLFNINPLMKYDGYYILSDLFDIPNLQSRSAKAMKSFFLNDLFKLNVELDTNPLRLENIFLVTYGIASFLYRMFLIVVIFHVVAEGFWGLGYLVVFFLLINWIVIPLSQGVYELFNAPQFFNKRSQILTFGSLYGGLIIGFLFLIPLPMSFQAEATIIPRQQTSVYSKVEGCFSSYRKPPNSFVMKDELLIQLEDPEIDFKIRSQESANKRLRTLIELSEFKEPEKLIELREQLAAGEKKIDYFKNQSEALEVRSPLSGIWIYNDFGQLNGRIIMKGQDLGYVCNPDELDFKAVIEQEHANYIFEKKIIENSSYLRFKGKASKGIPVTHFNWVPAEQLTLPSPALGWSGGGSIEVDPRDPQGIKVLRGLYHLRGEIPQEKVDQVYLNQTGVATFTLPPLPLGQRWVRSIKQILLEKHQI